MTFPIDVLGSGGVVLGPDVVCDGFHRSRRVRVQTHVHDDHMHDFNTSKGFQDLYMSEETRCLLMAEFNADLEVRENLIALAPGIVQDIGASKLSLVPNGHMLGSVQAVVETPEGLRLGYSGDFQWPMERPIRVDALVVDSTYGSPMSTRAYTQAEAETRFLELVLDRLRYGSVHVKSHRGTVQRALQVLSGNVSVPLLASDRLQREIAVYQRFGSAVAVTTSVKSPDGRAAIASKRYIRLYCKGDKDPSPLPEGTMIVLSAFMNKTNDPVMTFEDRSHTVALSNHADFLGTLEYVKATGARFVVTDNTRGRGVELAMALRGMLGIDAIPSTNVHSFEWGS